MASSTGGEQSLLLYNHNVSYYFRHDVVFRAEMLRLITFLRIALWNAAVSQLRQNRIKVFGEREIAKDIFAFLDARSLVAASEVCVCWSAIESIESEELWGSLCMVDYHVSPAALVSVKKKKKKKKEKESLTAKDLYKTSVKRLEALTRNTTKVEVSGLGVTCVDRSLLRL